MEVSRRNLFKMAGAAAIGAAVGNMGGNLKMAESKNTIQINQAPVIGSKNVTGTNYSGSAAKVYFTKTIDAEHLIKLYKMINENIFGKVAIKLHTGEKNGPNILPRDMVQAFQAQIPNSTIVECNTLYHGDRYTTEGHRETLKVNGWTFCDVDIMDEDEKTVNFPVKNGFHLKEVAMGANLANYDSLIVLTHFKGHAMGGFGGSMKNIGVGNASGHVGKAQVHGVDPNNVPANHLGWPIKEYFMELMCDSANATCNHFGKNIIFLNVMRRISVDCDCMGVGAAEPTMADIGIAVSTDILAVDQFCADMIYTAHDSHDMKERIESRAGLRQLSAMAEAKLGNTQYEVILVD